MIKFINLVLCLLFLYSNCLAQWYYFGRNKVQYTEFQWDILKTEHFDIYYHPEMKDIAERGAYFAEEAYAELQEKFNINILNKIPLVFYSSHLYFQQTNTTPGLIPEGVGGFFEFIKGRVVIPFDGSLYQFKHVIKHELIHVFTLHKVQRVLKDRKQPTEKMPPLWFTEGLAEFWSTKWDNQAEMLLRDAVLNGYIVPLSEMDRILGTFLMYKEGQNILEYIAQKYGEEKILLLLENFWKANSFEKVFELTIGKNYKQFDEEWLYHLKKKYYPLLKYNDPPSAVTKPLVVEGFNMKPVFYRNGDKKEIYFVGNITGYTNIYKIDLESKTKPKIVIEGERSDKLEAFHLFKTKIDVKNDKLAFITKSGDHDAIHIYDLRSEKITDMFQFNSLVMITSLSFSPDAEKLAITAIDKSGYSDIYIFDLKTKNLKKLTNDFYDDREVAWSPKGDKIAFISDRMNFGIDGKYNIFLYDVNEDKIEYFIYGNFSCSSPSWAPDGRFLAFSSDIDGTQNIWVIDLSQKKFIAELDGTFNLNGYEEVEIKQITNLTTAAFDPTWTDDGRIVCVALENLKFQIRMIENVYEKIEKPNFVQKINYQTIDKNHWDTPKIHGIQKVNVTTYRGKYDLDIAQSQISTDPIFGTVGGAAIALSDLLGNERYYILIYNTAQTKDEILKSFNIAISRVSLSKRTNFAYGIFHLAGRRYDLTDPDLFYYEKAYGGYFALSYPISVFRRVEASIMLNRSDKEILFGVRERKAMLLSNSLSYIFDNSLWSPTGPIDGKRFNITLAYTTDIQFSNVNYYTFIFDYRHYFRLSTRSAYAVRLTLFYNEGKEARRWFMGGSWDLRGYERWSIRGKKLWFVSQELRFPFIDKFDIKFPFGGIFIGSIRGALFFDTGNAWDNKYIETLGSVGFGIRFNIGGVIVLRYDVGKRLENNLSKFQKSFFHQFFFGWDF
jgi:hypothetical protein